MPSADKMTRRELRKLARQGRLVDECFKTFQRMVYPGASPEQVATMRICFFAGAAELMAITLAGLDDGVAETEGDLDFMEQWHGEVERFHERTIAAMQANDGGRPA
jgi:hypothetical protein